MSELPNAPSIAVREPFTLVIFGASGDLTRRKLIPALYKLFCRGLLPAGFRVVGVARRPWEQDYFRDLMCEAVQETHGRGGGEPGRWREFAGLLHYHRTNVEDPAGYEELGEHLRGNSPGPGVGNCMWYLATRPEQFEVVTERLREAGLTRPAEQGSWSRIVVEKPFGRCLDSARALNGTLRSAFDEEQIYRIDHYLGKEPVQNLLVLRFANSIFEPVWNQNYIDHVQIAVTEDLGVGTRGAFYEQTGAIRDIVQNHMMHLLSLVAMEPPVALEANAVRDEKVKVLRALRAIEPECVGANIVRGQYAAGEMHGQQVRGYHEEEGVGPESRVETFAALRVFVDNWRWAGVPFFLRTGKRLPTRISEIDIHFKPVPRVLFNTDSRRPLAPNLLAIRIQPNEGITLQFEAKRPGPAMEVEPFKMDFGFVEASGEDTAEAYERLLLDAARGDSTLFARSDEVEAAWAFLGPVLQGCDRQGGAIPQYPAGSWGPKEADALIERQGRRWDLMRRARKRHSELEDQF